ncbi:DivIVA domain-containing protein [Clostridium sediminicola]|uniref:DivIVA domain-containing protein n=1 Tax=Clostridium sediminicola TaxID=3114879 RepID=UPI0031F1FF27
MKITVMDIENKEFKKSFRGYDVDDVDEFLEDIAEDYETLYKENSSLKERLEVLEEKLENYKKIEDTINNTLVMAQKNAEQLKKNSQDEAELIIKRSSESAQKIIDNSHREVIKINNEYDRVKNEFLSFKTKYKNFMKSQTELFEELEKDFARNFSITHTEPSYSFSKTIENEIEEVLSEERKTKENETGKESNLLSENMELDSDINEPILENKKDEVAVLVDNDEFFEIDELESEIDNI